MMSLLTYFARVLEQCPLHLQSITAEHALQLLSVQDVDWEPLCGFLVILFFIVIGRRLFITIF